MRDLRDRFGEVDRLSMPVEWADVVGRSPSGAPPPPPRATGWRRTATIALALLLPAAVGAFMWVALRTGDRPDRPADPSPPLVSSPATADPTPSTDPSVVPSEAAHTLEPPFAADVWASFEAGWTELDAPPEVRTGAATAWTGRYLFVWGGYVYTGFSDETVADTGFVFDAQEGTWSEMAPAPISPRSDAAAAWTGSEFLVWGGAIEGPCCGAGAAYDPATGTWRVLPEAPVGARVPLSVWTGDELIVWGTGARTSPDPQRDGAAYDPASNSWRPIAEGPIGLTDAVAVWTGREMVVFGAELHGGNRAVTETAIGAAYDPATDSWRRLPDSRLSPQASTAAWTGHELVAWDYENRSQAYDPSSDRWRELPRVPLDFAECSPASVSVAGTVLGNYCGSLVLYQPDRDRWSEITQPEELERLFVVELVAAGDVVVVLGHGQDPSKRRAFAYRPG